MDNYISRQAAIDALRDWEMCYDWDEHCREEPKAPWVVSPSCVINKLPSAQLGTDCISRQAAIEKILGQPPEPHYPSWYAEQIKELPSAEHEKRTEERTETHGVCLDAISRQDALKDVESWVAVDEHEQHLQKKVIEWLKDFPPAHAANVGTPSGKWIKHIDDLFPKESTMECDQCHEHQPITIDDNFCPNCGADMRGNEDEIN